MKHSLLLAFYNRNFRDLWFAELFTQIPVNVFNFLLILVVFNLTKSNTAVSIIVLSFTLPAVFLGVLAGVYTDKWNKKNVLQTTNFLRVAALLILILFSNNIYVIYIISFFFGIVTQFFIPAESPLIPEIVTKDELLSANALFGIGIFGSILFAYLLSGPLLIYFGLKITLFLLALSITIGALLIGRIKVPLVENKKHFNFTTRIPLNEVKREITEVVSFILSARYILSAIILLAMSQIIILIIAAIAPGFANEVLYIKVEEFPILIVIPATVGIILGALLIANKLYSVRKIDLVTIGVFISAIVVIIMPFCTEIASLNIISSLNNLLPFNYQIDKISIIILLAFLLGIANALVFIPSNTILQEKTEDKIRGKIYGILNTFVGLFSFTPILLAGSFSDLIGVGKVVIGVGFALLALAFSMLIVKLNSN